MKASDLYAKLDKDFDVEHIRDDWSFMALNKYIAPDFKKRHMGVVLDNTDEIKKVYTATIPDPVILDKLIRTNETDMLLFSHHPMCYDPTIEGFPFAYRWSGILRITGFRQSFWKESIFRKIFE